MDAAVGVQPVQRAAARRAGRRPSSRSRSARPGRSRPRSSAPSGRSRARRAPDSVPSGSSSAKPRSMPMHRAAAAARAQRGGDLADVPALDRAVGREREDVAGEHVDPAQAAPARRPDRPLAVVGDRVGHLLGPHRLTRAPPRWAGAPLRPPRARSRRNRSSVSGYADMTAIAARMKPAGHEPGGDPDRRRRAVGLARGARRRSRRARSCTRRRRAPMRLADLAGEREDRVASRPRRAMPVFHSPYSTVSACEREHRAC